MKNNAIWDVALACVFVLTIFLLTEIAWVEVGGKAAPDFWTVMSAIGTVSATVVAVAVAVYTARANSREEAVRARLAAAQLAPVLLLTTGKLRAACLILEKAAAQVGSSESYRVAATTMQQVVEMQPSFEDLRSIASLPDSCADRIAAGFAQTKMISEMLTHDKYVYGDHPDNFPRRQQQCSMYIGMTKGILQALDPAVAVCNRASKIKIGGPAVK